MGTLKPGATYIYERSDGIVYAREMGSDPATRKVIGYETSSIYKEMADRYHDDKLWSRILEEAKTNETLQQAIDRVIMLYKLSVSKYD